MKSLPMSQEEPQAKLFDELRLALSRTSAEDMQSWGVRSAARLPRIGARRVGNFGKLLGSIGNATGKEIKSGSDAIKDGQFAEHIGKRSAAAIDGVIGVGRRLWIEGEAISRMLIDEPKRNAPGVLALALGFIAGSGGADANGGLPDTDIAMFGIGDHRSLFTHSIIAGIVVEGSILALADFAGIVCNKLPEGERSSFWNQLDNAKDQIALNLAAGASAGLSYHLAVDATLQPAAYKDLPISMPMEAHQMLFAVNAAVEGQDVAGRGKTTGQEIVSAIGKGFSDVESKFKAVFQPKR